MAECSSLCTLSTCCCLSYLFTWTDRQRLCDTSYGSQGCESSL